MAKKFGKVVLLGLIAGATAAGVYHYLQSKNSNTEEFDDFDDFDELDNLDFDMDSEDATLSESEKRNYVALDRAKAIAGDAFGKAKEAFTNIKDKIQDSLEANIDDEDLVEDLDFDDFSDVADEEKSANAVVTETIENVATSVQSDDTSSDNTSSDDDSSNATTAGATVEEFFDDDEE